MEIKFDNKVVQITGAGSGFGRTAAHLFGAAGAKLILSDVNEAGLAETVDQLGMGQDRMISMSCDISNEDDVARMVGTGVDHFGQLDIAINNAGIILDLLRLDATEISEFDKVMAVNVRGTFLCMQHELKQMVTQGQGIILNIASVAGLAGAPMMAAYAASKHAVVGMTKSAAMEYARKNIRINALCPAYCVTPMMTQFLDEEKGAKRANDMTHAIPMGRMGTPEEIANGMMWLCSDQNSFTTGQALAFDGGLTS